MKCPNCHAKLGLGAFVFNYYECPSCGKTLTSKKWLSAVAVLSSLPIGRLFYEGEYVIAGIATLAVGAFFIWKTPSTLEAR